MARPQQLFMDSSREAVRNKGEVAFSDRAPGPQTKGEKPGPGGAAEERVGAVPLGRRGTGVTAHFSPFLPGTRGCPPPS